ncbi:MAG: hypothetical protein JRJ87_18395 [Deltaproteobacteria bacterium]|nr:hypothetical protein [Deltaproteobacteria bacterium]
MQSPKRIWLSLVLLTITWAWNATAAQAPKVANHIPKNAVYVLFLSNPAEALTNLETILKPFTALSPELDLAKQGEKLKAELGVNILSPKGLDDLGLDSSGTSAFYEVVGFSEQVIALELKDPNLFKTKMLALMKQKADKFNPKPKKKRGTEIFEVDGGYIGIKGSWCVIQPEPAKRGPKDGPLLAFFKKGKKLSSSVVFKRAWSQMPEGNQAVYYMDMKLLANKLDAEMLRMTNDFAKMAPAKERKQIKKRFKQSRNDQRKIFKLINFIESISFGWSIEPKSISQATLLTASPKGLKVLKKLVAAQSDVPAFHQGLIETAIAGGWTSANISKIVKHFGPTPIYPGFTFKHAWDREEKSFKEETQIDITRDLLANLKGPAAAYLLNPGKVKADPTNNLPVQIFKMMRIAIVAQVADPAKMSSVVKLFNQFVQKQENPIETKTVSSAEVTVFRPETGVELAWGIKGNTAFFTFGENTAQALVKILPDQPWAKQVASGQLASGQMDFAALTEAISSAVSQGIGGQQASQFRMVVWPMVQQVLSKIEKISFSSEMKQKGLTLTGKITLH